MRMFQTSQQQPRVARRSIFAAMAIAGVLLASATISSTASSSEVGYLTVSSVPPAKVFIDDFDTGRTTPIDQLALPPGNHRLRLEAGALKRALGFKITAGATTRLKINL